MAIRWKNPSPTRGKCNILGDDEHVVIALPSSLVSSDTHSIQGTMNGALPFLIIVTLLFHLAFSSSIEKGKLIYETIRAYAFLTSEFQLLPEFTFSIGSGIKKTRRSRSVGVTEEEPE